MPNIYLMKFRRKYSRFTVSRRYNRTLDHLIDGCATVRSMQEEGKIITAEKIYNRKLCYYYGICRGLLKRRAEELESTQETAIADLEKIRQAFLAFYTVGEGFKVDLSAQKDDAMSVIDRIIEVFAAKQG